MSKKYIIEIEDEPLVRNSALHGETAVYKAVGFNSLVFDQNGLDKLTPYNESSEEEHEVGNVYIDDDNIVYCLLDMDCDCDESGWLIDKNGCVDYHSLRNLHRHNNKNLCEYLDNCIDNIVKALQNV